MKLELAENTIKKDAYDVPSFEKGNAKRLFNSVILLRKCVEF